MYFHGTYNIYCGQEGTQRSQVAQAKVPVPVLVQRETVRVRT